MDEPIQYASPYQPQLISADQEHLRLLRIFHFVLGGIQILFGCMFVMYIVMGVLIVNGRLPGNGVNPNQSMPSQFGYFFIVMGVVAIAMMWTIGILLLMSGRFLGRHEHHTFSFVIAILSCLNMPLGTILGVFTLIVLSRSSVKALYAK